MSLLDLPFVLLVTHPAAFLLGMVGLYGLCYVPGLLLRKRG